MNYQWAAQKMFGAELAGGFQFIAGDGEGVLYFNPGSAGPRRFSLPVTVGRLRVTDSGVEGHIQELDVPGPRKRE